MKKSIKLICSGDACPLRHTCRRFQDWLDNEDDVVDVMSPEYREDGCRSYKRKEYYGQ